MEQRPVTAKTTVKVERGPIIDASANVRAIIAAHPRTVPVFEKYGLMGCGGAAGPDESVGFFVQIHHVPLAELLRDLDRAVRGEPLSSETPTPPVAVRPDQEQRFVPFFIGSLALTLTFGATLGLINLVRLTGTWWGTLPKLSVWAHAYVQVFGFVGLFVMGVAYHVIPRFVAAPLQAERFSRWSFRLQLAGVLSVASGFFLPAIVMHPLWVAGTAALLAAAILFATSIARTVRAGQPAPEPFEPWIIAGALWLVIASAVALVAAVRNDATLHHVLWPAALFGFAGSWIFGIGRRIFPVFLGWETRWPRLEPPIFLLYHLGVLAWSVGAWPEHGAVLPFVRAAGAVALIVAVAAYATILGLFGPRSAADGDLDRGYERYIYAAWGWLFVGLITGPAWTLGALAHGGYGSITMLDFARHAIAFGFITQMIMGVASRVLPVFTGHRLWSPIARAYAFWLLNLGVALRGLEVIVAAGYWPEAWPLIALSGPPAVAAVFLFAANVVMTVRAAGPAIEAWRRRADPADTIVAGLVDIPGALDVLVEAGFTPLRNPVLRAAFARAVTLRQACRMKSVPLEPLAARIRELEEQHRGAAQASPRPAHYGPRSASQPAAQLPAGWAPVKFVRRGAAPADPQTSQQAVGKR